jgi:hypothetical protein
MGMMAFEGYVPAVRVIRERPDAEFLFAAALRAFFLWDRMRRAQDEATAGAGSIEALEEARGERGGRRGGRRDEAPREGGGGQGARRRRGRRGGGPRS